MWKRGTISARAAHLAATFLTAGCATIAGAPRQSSDEADAPAAPVFLQADVLGLDAGALDALLGPASLVRREGAGEFRRYAFVRCELIVILYPDESGVSTVRQLDAAAKKSGDEKPDIDSCLAGGPQAGAEG